MSITVALIGNPNCGKTTLFNLLTGTYQKTGNWTGVTTEKKSGVYRKDKRVNVVDLPGLYSLNAKSDDERAVLAYLKETPPDVIVNVVDGTNLERNLYLTCELSELNIPTVIAVNMYDDLNKNGIKLNSEKLAAVFGVDAVPVSALKNLNVDKLMSVAASTKKRLTAPDLKKEKGNTKSEKRYAFIERHVNGIIKKKQTRAEKFTQKADDVLTHRVFGIPIFFCVITLVYFLSMKIGGAVGEVISELFSSLADITDVFLKSYAVPEWLISLVCNAIIKSTGTVVSFLPQILVLFALMAIIEESGYASRVAFIMDRFFRSFGLSGKSLIPMIVSCGCTVSGLMATRTIENKSERRMTIFLAPFMPCGAKTAVFGWFSYSFFNGSAIVAASMYFLGIICTAVFGKILKRFKAFSSNDGAFILEMPTLRLPSLKDVFFVLWEKIKDFTGKAGMIVFIVSVALWILQNFGFAGYVYGNVEKSFLFATGNALKFFFYPLGFGNWQASVSVLTGILAKEAVVETMRFVSADPASLFYNSFSVYAFMAFVLLSPPCAASIAAAKQELKSGKWLFFMLGFQLIAAYSVALAINLTGILFERNFGLILSAIIVIIIALMTFIFIKAVRKDGCGSCTACNRGRNRCQKKGKRFTT